MFNKISIEHCAAHNFYQTFLVFCFSSSIKHFTHEDLTRFHLQFFQFRWTIQSFPLQMTVHFQISIQELQLLGVSVSPTKFSPASLGPQHCSWEVIPFSHPIYTIIFVAYKYLIAYKCRTDWMVPKGRNLCFEDKICTISWIAAILRMHIHPCTHIAILHQHRICRPLVGVMEVTQLIAWEK